jgi:hypothetical protein
VRFESRLLEFLTLIPVVVAVVRSILAYRRMSIRYENFVNDMIATKTVAQQGTVLAFLAAAAAQQQFASAAVVYAVLVRGTHAAGRVARNGESGGMTASQVRRQAEEEAARHGLERPRFDALSALETLSSFGLVEGSDTGDWCGEAGGEEVRWRPSVAAVGEGRLAEHWAALLEQAVTASCGDIV